MTLAAAMSIGFVLGFFTAVFISLGSIWLLEWSEDQAYKREKMLREEVKQSVYHWVAQQDSRVRHSLN